MLAARFLEPVDQNGIGSIEEKNFIWLSLATHFLQRAGKREKHILTAADIRHDGDAAKFFPCLLAEAVKGFQQLRRQIVDAIKADILQCVNRLRLSSPRQARNDQKFHHFFPYSPTNFSSHSSETPVSRRTVS